jgi:hypothetical protein
MNCCISRLNFLSFKVTALLQRPSEDLTLDDVEFLLKSLRQVSTVDVLTLEKEFDREQPSNSIELFLTLFCYRFFVPHLMILSPFQTPAPSAQSSKHSSHHHHHHDHSSSQGGGGYHSSSQDGGRSSSGQLPSGSFGDEDDLDDGYSD